MSSQKPSTSLQVTATANRVDRITSDPGRMNGKPCIRGAGLTVRRVVEAVALYPDRDELKRE